MEPSKFIKKFTGIVFKDISERGFFESIYYYITDSRERTRVKLTDFLSKQLIPKEYTRNLKRIALGLTYDYPNPDLRIIEILKLVYKRVKYVPDRNNFGKIEYWADAAETWNRRKDDCDGINALIFVLARLSGISPLQIWSAIGTTSEGGHYWLVYFSLKTDKWYSIDGTFNVNLRPISLRNVFRFRNTRYKSIWCLFNDYWSFKPR